MSEVPDTVSRTIPVSLEDAWQAMHRTADLQVTDGWKTTERTSDSSWKGSLDKATVTCDTAFDEATHTAEVTMHNSMKRRTVDTMVIQAEPAQEGTQVTVTSTIRGGAVTMFMSRLTGEGALEKIGQNVIANIEALCTGREAHGLSQDQLDSYARARLDELEKESNK